MSDPIESVELAVTVIANENGEVLFDYNSSWGVFSLPMTKIGTIPGPTPKSEPLPETAEAAALRAAVEVLGHPLPKGHRPKHVEVHVPPYQQSGRDGSWKRYSVQVFVLRAPAGKACPLDGHSAVWLPRNGLADLAPISPTVNPILDAITPAVWAGLMGG
ncbi:hypothetical protein [Zavarzinella formosa]|uniref:hypothetical protein n=1 Tax=Zavarzinella formosa TaxID=360055 RepID=UPI0003119261|nr:hypothetical protein [Zavarzinella formosa]